MSLDHVPAMKSRHACFLVGTHALFAIHMINAWIDCHRYQLILRIDLPGNIKDGFIKHRSKNPGKWYIIGNTEKDMFSLPDIKRGEIRSFQASLWSGWPTKEGSESWPWANDEPILNDFEIRIRRVVCFRRLDFNESWPRTANYVLFGEGTEAYINHSPIKQPDYDHLATLSAVPSWLPNSLLEAGVPINFPTVSSAPGGTECRDAVHLSNPINEGRHSVQYSGCGPERHLDIGETIFFSTWPFNRTDPNPSKQEDWRPCAPPHHHIRHF